MFFLTLEFIMNNTVTHFIFSKEYIFKSVSKNPKLYDVTTQLCRPTFKKFVTDLLKKKAGTTYVNNELTALKKRVKVLESTVAKLQRSLQKAENS